MKKFSKPTLIIHLILSISIFSACGDDDDKDTVAPVITLLKPETSDRFIRGGVITINANAHALMNRYGHPGSDKSMPAILNEGAYDAWLQAKVAKAREFLRPYPAQKLTANPVEKGRKPPLF